MRYYFKSVNLIGDALNISPAWRVWLKQNVSPGSDDVYLHTLNDHITPLYQGMVRDIAGIETVFEKPEGKFDFEHTFDVSAAFKISDAKKCHVAESYAELLGVQLAPGDSSLKPTYIPDYVKEHEVHDSSEQIRLNQDCILISMFSASCTSRDPKFHGVPNKMVPWSKWKPMLTYLRDRFPDTSIRFLGAPTDMVPNGYALEIVNPGEYMLGIPLNRLALIMKQAKLVVTIDNGMSHLAATQEARTFLMYPDCLGTHFIVPKGNPNLAYIQMNPVYVAPPQLLYNLKKAVERFKL